ncbi:MAG: CvpA family protein [Rickettsiales bacterium]|jgi:membrane protein required for colicin V production|nr:CvpA family protein [Rickettsiales bacterium]
MLADFMITDYIYIAVVLASTFWAFARGGVFETVATMSWIVSAIMARFTSSAIEAQLQKMFALPEPTVSTLLASYFIVFFAILILFSFFAQRIRDYIHSTILRSADRSLGILFGLARGVIINGFIYIAMLWYWSGLPLPQYVSAAKTRPIMQITALKIYEWFIPGPDKMIRDDLKGKEKVIETYETLINPKVRSGQNIDADEEAGYKATERDSLDSQLLQIDTLSDTAE